VLGTTTVDPPRFQVAKLADARQAAEIARAAELDLKRLAKGERQEQRQVSQPRAEAAA
jgi:hypothetical protein